MFRYAETEGDVVAFFTAAEVQTESQLIDAGTGILALVKYASSASKHLVLDFSGVKGISSAIVGALVLASKIAKNKRTGFRLAGVDPVVMDVFSETRLNKVFRIERRSSAKDLLEAAIPFVMTRSDTKPCPSCGQPLRTSLAKQCLHCGEDWH